MPRISSISKCSAHSVESWHFSAHDAAYVALAESIAEDPVPVVTADARLARAASDHAGVPVLLFG
jgi:predicted nucleic acid-binding protein